MATRGLTAELVAAKKLDVVLAGRNKEALTGMGDWLSLPTRVVGLSDARQLSEALKDIACVVHMAGPFAATSAPMLNACLATPTNYIDISGEIEGCEAMWSREEEIKRAGITVVPGAGFDVVPTDCLAGYVASKLERTGLAGHGAARAGKRISRHPAHRHSPTFETCLVPAGGNHRCPRGPVTPLDRFRLRR